MDIKKENLPVKMEYTDMQTVPLALHEMHMARNNRLLRWLCVAWAVSIVVAVVATVAINAWLWNQYDYESSTELSGVYNLVDSQGNVVSADLSSEDVIRILQEINDGENQAKPVQN